MKRKKGLNLELLPFENSRWQRFTNFCLFSAYFGPLPLHHFLFVLYSSIGIYAFESCPAYIKKSVITLNYCPYKMANLKKTPKLYAIYANFGPPPPPHLWIQNVFTCFILAFDYRAIKSCLAYTEKSITTLNYCHFKMADLQILSNISKLWPPPPPVIWMQNKISSFFLVRLDQWLFIMRGSLWKMYSNLH